MSINFDLIANKFIELASTYVGDKLSTIEISVGGVPTQVPAVIRQRPDGAEANPPYITVDILTSDDENGWEVFSGVDEDDYVYTETVQSVLIVYRCYGGDAIQIINDLRGYLKLPNARNSVREDLEGSIVTIFGASNLPYKVIDKYIESASFNVLYNQVHRATDSNAPSVIESIDLEPTYNNFTEVIVEDDIIV